MLNISGSNRLSSRIDASKVTGDQTNTIENEKCSSNAEKCENGEVEKVHRKTLINSNHGNEPKLGENSKKNILDKILSHRQIQDKFNFKHDTKAIHDHSVIIPWYNHRRYHTLHPHTLEDHRNHTHDHPMHSNKHNNHRISHAIHPHILDLYRNHTHDNSMHINNHKNHHILYHATHPHILDLHRNHKRQNTGNYGKIKGHARQSTHHDPQEHHDCDNNECHEIEKNIHHDVPNHRRFDDNDRYRIYSDDSDSVENENMYFFGKDHHHGTGHDEYYESDLHGTDEDHYHGKMDNNEHAEQDWNSRKHQDYNRKHISHGNKNHHDQSNENSHQLNDQYDDEHRGFHWQAHHHNQAARQHLFHSDDNSQSNEEHDNDGNGFDHNPHFNHGEDSDTSIKNVFLRYPQMQYGNLKDSRKFLYILDSDTVYYPHRTPSMRNYENEIELFRNVIKSLLEDGNDNRSHEMKSNNEAFRALSGHNHERSEPTRFKPTRFTNGQTHAGNSRGFIRHTRN